MVDIAENPASSYRPRMAEYREQLRAKLLARVESGAESYYAISKATKIDHAQLSRFARRAGGGMSADSLVKLAEHLGYHIELRPNKRQSPRKQADKG